MNTWKDHLDTFPEESAALLVLTNPSNISSPESHLLENFIMSTHVSRFSKDHWSLLAYIETLCVEGQGGLGKIQRAKVRTNHHTHPLLASQALWKDEHSTRLQGFFEFPDRHDIQRAAQEGFAILGHDDWDCLDDLEHAGLINILSLTQGAIVLTPTGQHVAGLLRTHKSSGGQFAGFAWNPEPLTKPHKL